MAVVQGRAGRTIVVDEVQAQLINRALNNVAHSRDRSSTQPVDIIATPTLSLLDRFDAWGDRCIAWLARRGVWLFMGCTFAFIALIVAAGLSGGHRG